MRVEGERERGKLHTKKRQRGRESVCNGPRTEGHYRHKTYEVEERGESGMQHVSVSHGLWPQIAEEFDQASSRHGPSTKDRSW